MPTSSAPMDPETVEELLRPALVTIGLAGSDSTEGRRERKKRQLRQHISDTATGMFLEKGFNAVTVRQVAEACDVSEKTVFNYFPTKESLLLDREEYEAALITEALRDKGDGRSLVESVLLYQEAEVNFWISRWQDRGFPEESLKFVHRFGQVVDESPSLAAAMMALSERLTQVAAKALAERAGVSPDDPEPQMAAAIVMDLWRRRQCMMQRMGMEASGFDDLRERVMDDLRRSARVADTGLLSFNLVVQSRSVRDQRDQLREAAEITNEARKQVVAAVRKARDAWKQVVKEAKAAHQAHDEREERAAKRDTRRAAHKERHAEMAKRHQEKHEAMKRGRVQQRPRLRPDDS